MNLRYIAAAFVIFLASGALLFATGSSSAGGPEGFQSLYIVTHAISDASPFWFEYVLDVRAQGTGVLVRDIRIAPLNSICTRNLTVKAIDHLLPNLTVKKLTRIDLCSLNTEFVASAIRAAQPKAAVSVDDTASYTLVAMCGKSEKVFSLPVPEAIDFKLLKKTSPRIASLWELASNVQRRAFGKDFSFYRVSMTQAAAFQALGAQVVPAMKSGIYDRGFEDRGPLASLLNDYSGPLEETEPSYVDLVDQPPPKFLKYDLPRYPPLAKQARIQGDVNLVITEDTQTGLVKDVETTSGQRLLVDAAVRAALQWQFQPGTNSRVPIELTVRFGFRCISR
jgi:TonB family protein